MANAGFKGKISRLITLYFSCMIIQNGLLSLRCVTYRLGYGHFS